jgi:hypothetical protein
MAQKPRDKKASEKESKKAKVSPPSTRALKGDAGGTPVK